MTVSVIRRVGFAVGMALAVLLTSSASYAQWRDDFRVFRVGVVTGDNAPYRLAQLQPFKEYLESRLSLPVEIFPAETYDALIDAQAGGGVHYAIYSATAFVTAAAKCQCVEPLALPTRSGGEAGFHALLIARADGPVAALDEAEGSRLAVAAEDSIAGRLLQMRGFEEEGIVPSSFFSEIIEMRDPALAISALLADEADLAVAWSSLSGDRAAGYSFGALAQLVAEGGLSMDQIEIVWQSPLIPFGPHAILSDLPDELKELLSRALLALAFEDPAALDAVDRFGGRGFIAADAGIYAPIEALITPFAAGQ